MEKKVQEEKERRREEKKRRNDEMTKSQKDRPEVIALPTVTSLAFYSRAIAHIIRE